LRRELITENFNVTTERDKSAAAAYVADLTADLARMARRHGLDALGYILDMVRLEAENAARDMNGDD
jgi:hypothetical protein